MQSDFYRMKNFANPKFKFKSNSLPSAGIEETQGQSESNSNAKPTVSPISNGESKKASENSDPVKFQETPDDAKNEATEPLFKHPLQNSWTLWYLENDHKKTWEEMQHVITTFNFVEDFWSLYNHIIPPSVIKMGSDYSLFKKDIRPMWEDAANKQGGRWVITLNKSSKQDLDNLWLDVLLCMIGETFKYADQICGAVVNIRNKCNKISLWTANASDKEAVLEIGHKLREDLRLGRQCQLHYHVHKDTIVKRGSTVKSIYIL
ncbi:eukaryotic translation initiation factor 4E1-like [Drosophila tropicalis]|uniref:eukaryotic translation initiation factor 4E1-like n=1 Tax=Drosophila tropicalis TaxID=46794 RepID=UPI0035AC0763